MNPYLVSAGLVAGLEAVKFGWGLYKNKNKNSVQKVEQVIAPNPVQQVPTTTPVLDEATAQLATQIAIALMQMQQPKQ